MNDDEPLSDLEQRLHAWRPAELPADLRTRLCAAGPASRRERRSPRLALAAACALAAGAALLLATRSAPPPNAANLSGPVVSSARPRTADPERTAEPHWVLGESLTMNIHTGVPLGTVPAALRLDGDFVAQSGLIPIRITDGKLPLKVDCQF